MDIRTATQLCLTDLVAIIDRGDFRAIGEAERIIAEFAASASNEQNKGALLGRLAEKLSDVATPIGAEPDALLRAIKAEVRRELQRAFKVASYALYA